MLEAVTLLVEHGVDVNAFNANGQTILHNAAQRGQNSVIEYVAQKGAKLDRRDKQGRTALDIALGAGSGGRRQGRPATRPCRERKDGGAAPRADGQEMKRRTRIVVGLRRVLG